MTRSRFPWSRFIREGLGIAGTVVVIPAYMDLPDLPDKDVWSINNFTLNEWIDKAIFADQQYDWHVYDEDIDYCGCLDAVNGAEKRIRERGLCTEYERALSSIVHNPPPSKTGKSSVTAISKNWLLFNATARQRSEAIYAIREHLIS